MPRFTPLAAAVIAVTLLAVTLFAVTAEAQSQSRRYPNGRIVYVQPRSFLDPGRVVPTGHESQYVYIGQYDNTPPYYNQLRAQETFLPRLDPRFMNSNMPAYGPFSGY